MNNYAPPLQGTANNLAQYGRYGDSMLVHMNPAEVDGIASLSPTGRLTINPVTGQPEAFLPFLAPLLGGVAGQALLTGAFAGGSYAGLSAATAGAIGSGLASWAQSGDIEQGLMSGITGYGIGTALGKLGGGGASLTGETGAELASGITGAGTDAAIGAGTDAAIGAGTDAALASAGTGAGMATTPGGMFDPDLGHVVPSYAQPRSLMPSGGYNIDDIGNIYDVSGKLVSDLGQSVTTPNLNVSPADQGLWASADERLQAVLGDEQLIPELMQQAPVMAVGEMGRAELQAQKEMEEAMGRDSEEEEEDLSRQYAILGGAWDQLASDYNYPVQSYPRYSGGGQVQYFQAGGMPIVGGPEAAAARQASIRGSVFVPPPTVNEAGQPWRAGFDPEHNYFGNVIPPGGPPGGPPGLYQSAPPGTLAIYDPRDPASNVYGGEGPEGVPLGASGFPSSGFRYGDLRPRRGDYDAETGYMEYVKAVRGWNAAQNPNIGTLAPRYQEGGIVDLAENNQAMMAEQPVDPAMQAEMMPDPAMQAEMMSDPAMQQETQMVDELIQQTILAILGRVDDPDVIIDMFIGQFGQEAYLALREEVLNTVVPGAQTEGMIEGQGDGMSDEVMGMIGDQEQVATSAGEYIVPADVVSGIGNGSSDAGASELDRMMADIRQARTGMTEQPSAINPEELMPI